MNNFSKTMDIIKQWIFIIVWAGGFFFSGIFVMIIGIIQGISEGDTEVLLFMVPFGLIFAAIGGIGGFFLIKPLLNAQIKKKGYAIRATVSEIVYKTNIYINGEHPGYIVATAVNENNEAVNFKSRNIGYVAVKGFKVGDTLSVYVLDGSYKKYEFDYEEIYTILREIESKENSYEQSTENKGKNVLTTDYNNVFSNANKSNDFSSYNKIKEEQNRQN